MTKQYYLCVHCGYQNEAIYRIFSESALTLQNCRNCSHIIDKYVEYDFTTILVDIMLLKISAYRHVLFNTNTKAYLPRIMALTLLSCSYVEWVYEKDRLEQRREPIFYELGWGYYLIICSQLFQAILFAGTFLVFGFMSSKLLNVSQGYFSCQHMIQGMAMSYCWNLVTVPSLVWNHYSTYYVLSQIALLISCIHVFQVCVHVNGLFSFITVGCAYGVQINVVRWLYPALPSF